MNRIPITFFDDTFARTISIKRMSMHDLRDLIVTTNAPEKASLKLLKLAKFNDTRSANNSYRYNDNVRAISGVELDYDDEEISVETAIEKIKAANLRSLIYTSPSHTNEKPRWRILLPTSTGLPPAIRPGLVARVNGILGGIISDESFVLSQPFYFGKVGDNPDHKAVIVDGDFVDLRDDLDEGALGKAGKSKTNGGDAAYIDDAKYMEDIRSGAAYHIPLLSLSARRICGGMIPEEVAGYPGPIWRTRANCG